MRFLAVVGLVVALSGGGVALAQVKQAPRKPATKLPSRSVLVDRIQRETQAIIARTRASKTSSRTTMSSMVGSIKSSLRGLGTLVQAGRVKREMHAYVLLAQAVNALESAVNRYGNSRVAATRRSGLLEVRRAANTVLTKLAAFQPRKPAGRISNRLESTARRDIRVPTTLQVTGGVPAPRNPVTITVPTTLQVTGGVPAPRNPVTITVPTTLEVTGTQPAPRDPITITVPTTLEVTGQ